MLESLLVWVPTLRDRQRHDTIARKGDFGRVTPNRGGPTGLWDDAELAGEQDRLRPSCNPQLFEQACDVGLHRIGR